MTPVCPSRLEHNVLTFHVTQLAQALSAGLPQVSGIRWSEGEEIADTRHSLWRLRCQAKRDRQQAHPDRGDKDSSLHTVRQEHNSYFGGRQRDAGWPVGCNLVSARVDIDGSGPPSPTSECDARSGEH